MKTNKLRVIIPLAVLVLAGIGFVAHLGIGTLSAIGWEDISILCPLGALGTMLASKTVVPRSLISLVVAVVGIVILGRAFCGWICPVPVWSKLRGILKKQPSGDAADAGGTGGTTDTSSAAAADAGGTGGTTDMSSAAAADADGTGGATDAGVTASVDNTAATDAGATKPLSDAET